MNAQLTRAEELCHWCGKPLPDNGAIPYDGNFFCCEGCYLGQLAQDNNQRERDEAYLAFAESLVTALDAREHETGLHSKRVACHTMVLARQSISGEDKLRQIYWGALLHDIGKVAIPDAILLKQGPLNDREWEIMRSHSQRGYDIVAAVPFMRAAADIILCHEERFDGNGYPRGLQGDEIPWGARLFTVIDTLDAMTSDRPYRKALSFDAAKTEIQKMSGSQFDPQAVTAFLEKADTLRRMVEMKCVT